MKTYRVLELTVGTPTGRQVRLLQALRALSGVQFVQLYPHMGTCGIQSTPDGAINHIQVVAAAASAGFSFERVARER